MKNQIGSLLIISGPSGVGKTTIAKEFAKRHRDYMISISVTTRPKRYGEKNGVDYIFLDEDQFIFRVLES